MTTSPGWQHGTPPGHGRDAWGRLLLGGIPAADLARQYGTPLAIMDLDVVDASIAALQSVCDPRGIDISYAAKAFFCVGFGAYLAAKCIGIDVCSLGELVTAERAGIAATRLTLHGAGKDDAELDAVAQGRVGSIAVDSIDELARLAQRIGEVRDGPSAEVILRLNTRIAAETHAFVRTGGDDTKFGIDRSDERAAATLLRDRRRLRFAGLHAHVGSQIYEAAAFVANAQALLEAAFRMRELGLTATRLVVGGGFGVQTRPQAQYEFLDAASAVAAAHAAIVERCGQAHVPVPAMGIEPGRAIVAHAGTTLYRVSSIKVHGERTFVVIDGGMADNPRPALYGAYHHVVPVDRAAGPEIEATLCGRSCENDELGNLRLPADLRSGDLLAMCTTGAYTFSMASNYNRFPRPAVVAVQGGRERLVVRRETLDDVLGRDA